MTRLINFGLCAWAILTFGGCAHFSPSADQNNKANIFLQLSADHFNASRYNQALIAVNKAIEAAPDMAEAYNQQALIFMESRQYESSLSSFKKAMELKPLYPEAWNNLGVLYNRMSKYELATEWFNKAINEKTYPTPENAQTNLGYAYYKLGKLTSAKAHHQKALDFHPNFCLAQKNLADVYVKEKNYRKAARNYESALQNCPLYQESRYKLSLVLVKMGEKDLAKAELNKLVERHKNGPYVNRSQRVLKYLH